MTTDRVWITGASSGIGEALALRCAERLRCRLVLSARRGDVLEKVANRCLELGALEARVVVLDQASPISPEVIDSALVDGIDAVYLNGGVSSRGSALATSQETLERVMRINFSSQAELARKVALKMLSDGTEGRIVVTSSVQGYFGLPMRSSYAASKHALHGYLDSLRAELTGTGISVTVCAPGYVNTALSQNAVTAEGSAYGETDPTTAGGADPVVVADAIIDAGRNRLTEVDVKPGASATAAKYLRRFAPWLVFRKLASRALENQQLTTLIEEAKKPR